jgi:hypothetical protein
MTPTPTPTITTAAEQTAAWVPPAIIAVGSLTVGILALVGVLIASSRAAKASRDAEDKRTATTLAAEEKRAAATVEAEDRRHANALAADREQRYAAARANLYVELAAVTLSTGQKLRGLAVRLTYEGAGIHSNDDSEALLAVRAELMRLAGFQGRGLMFASDTVQSKLSSAIALGIQAESDGGYALLNMTVEDDERATVIAGAIEAAKLAAKGTDELQQQMRTELETGAESAPIAST